MGVPLRTEIVPETIEFKSRYERQTVTFEIKNNGEVVQMYKIKTTNSKDFKIKPVYFAIEKNQKRKVNVTYNGKIEKANSKDRITVVYGHQLNLATTVEQAWEDQRHLQNISMVERRKYVKIAYRDNTLKKPDDSITASKTAMPRSVTVKPVLPTESQMSGINRDQDSYFAIPPGGPAKIALPKKKPSGSSRMEVNEGTTEDGKNRGSSSKSKKSNNNDATQTADASQEDGGEAPPPPMKKKGGTRKKVAPPPPPQEEEEDDAPKTALPVPPLRRKYVEEEPPRPKTRKAPPPPPQEEEEEEEAPPPPKVTPKKGGTRPTPPPPPPPPSRPARSPAPMLFNDEDQATELDAKPISKIVPVPAKKTQPPQPKSKRKRNSSSFDPLASLMNDSKIIYVVQQPSREDEDEEESERKPKKKSKENKKKTTKRKSEEDEDEEQ
uniref:Major sperm protein n=1 Tax=Pristionchus pacificus TaxID=54126 RepID=A0A8R1U3E0_PRIPA